VALIATSAALASGEVDTSPFARGAALAQRLGDTVCLTYAQLVFSKSRTVGAFLLGATAVEPRALFAGLASVLLALGAARALKLSPEQSRSGQLAYNALMVGLALAALAPPTATTFALGAVAVVASVMVTASMHLMLGVRHGLPVLTLPFLAVFYTTLGAAPAGVSAHLHGPEIDTVRELLPPLVYTYLQSIGSFLFLPRVDAGLIVLCAFIGHSRIATCLSFAGFALAWTIAPEFAHADPAFVPMLGLNCMLVAVALGSVWFIPSVWSYALALVGVSLCAVFGAGMAVRFERVGLPLLIVPFNVVVPMVLYVMRQRIADGRPHAVDFTPGTPEQNLAYFRSRSERFGSVLGVRLAAPFRGKWSCSQSVSGGVTHEGPWRHALDFEVFDHEGRAWREMGEKLEDFYCYKLPVVAPAAGTVARVIEGVRDNPVGEVNLNDNWGNVVIIYHAPGVYSCLAHLSPGTITVREGQVVQSGEVVGLCGNSGRSATPHLHLQMQSTAIVGAHTIPIELHDVVTVAPDGASQLSASRVPLRGEVVRKLEHDPERAGLVRFEYGRPTRATVESGRAARHETFVADIDLLGRQLLRSTTTDAALYYEQTATAFTVHDVVGDASSVLRLVRVALSRVPLDSDETLTWTDRLPLRPFLPVWLRPLFDAMSPFGGPASLTMRYSARRWGRGTLIEGASEKRFRDGRPWVTTTACLAPRAGLVRIDARVRTREFHIEIDPTPEPAVFNALNATVQGASHV
jgi:murein DD-endopeptidase MepM/ murein hydrolase activator NlpD/urea transporter